MLQRSLEVFKCVCQNCCTYLSPLYQIKPRFCCRFKLLLLPCVTLTVAFGNTNFATCGLDLDTSYVCGTRQFTTGSESRFFSKYWQDFAMTKLNFEERLFIEKRHSIKKKIPTVGSVLPLAYSLLIEGEKCCNLRAITLKYLASCATLYWTRLQYCLASFLKYQDL